MLAKMRSQFLAPSSRRVPALLHCALPRSRAASQLLGLTALFPSISSSVAVRSWFMRASGSSSLLPACGDCIAEAGRIRAAGRGPRTAACGRLGTFCPVCTMLHRALLLVPSALRSSCLSGRASSLLRPLLTSPAPLSAEISPGKGLNFPPVPPGSTLRVLMGFGLRVCSHARRPRPASLPVRLPAVGSLPPASFSHGLAAAALLVWLRLLPSVPISSFHLIS